MTKSGLNPEQPYRCVDIGAGRGVFRHLIEQDTAWIVDCVDLDQQALDDSLGNRGDNFYYDVFDQHEAMLNKYDGLFLLDVLEHVDDAAAFLDASLTHLKPGGFFVINVPTPGCLGVTIRPWVITNDISSTTSLRSYPVTVFQFQKSVTGGQV